MPSEQSSDDVERMREADEAGYPAEDLDELLTEAEERFLAKVDEHGRGENWLGDEARWHIWKACDELFQARDCAHAGRTYPTRLHMADALNHMLFALQVTRYQREIGTDTDHDGGDA